MSVTTLPRIAPLKSRKAIAVSIPWKSKYGATSYRYMSDEEAPGTHNIRYFCTTILRSAAVLAGVDALDPGALRQGHNPPLSPSLQKKG